MEKRPYEDDVIEAEIVSETIIEEEKKKTKKFQIELWHVLTCLFLVSMVWIFTGNLRTYLWARLQVQFGQYEQAITSFEQVKDYYDAESWLQHSQYLWGKECYENNEYLQAIEILESIKEYEEAVFYYEDSCYQHGHNLFMDYQYEEADLFFSKIEDLSLYGYPHFKTIEDANDYIVEQALQIREEIVVYIGENYTFEDGTLTDALLYIAQSELGEMRRDAANRKYRIIPQYYPGVRIVHAHNIKDTSILTEDEMALYQKALKIVEDAEAKTSTLLELEVYLYDYLCNHIVYKEDSLQERNVYPRTWTSIGALLDGEAICQGFSDAFYVLASLAGFDVRFQFGDADGLHVWNSIYLDDAWYYVDATFGKTLH